MGSLSARPARIGFAIALLMLCPVASFAQYTPEHPTVQKMVDRGLDYLQKSGQQALAGDVQFGTGGVLLIGLTFLKVTGDPEHPMVKQAIAGALRLVKSLPSLRDVGDSKVVYETAVACLLLADADSGQYRPQLDSIRDWFVSVQKSHGGYGYLGQPTGDTSQTQYAMLALWTLNVVGVDVPARTVESTLQYLRATQDPSGGWGYQGKISQGQLVAQDSVTKSLSTAGLGAVLIGGDILGFFGRRKALGDEEELDIPKAFVRIDLQHTSVARRDVAMSVGDIESSIQRGNLWQNQHQNDPPTSLGWYYYYRYSQERYQSFLEIRDNRTQKSPSWYNAGVEDLRRLQTQNGSWSHGSLDMCPDDICTAFAVLYLIRSTQKAIGKLREGVMSGGYGLPKNLGTVQRIGDRIVSSEQRSIETLIESLEGANTDSVEVGLVPKNLRLSNDPTIRAAQVARLSRLLYGKDWQARRVAARLIGRSDDLNQVPDLIFALTDEDPEVPVIAEESLRLLSRKLTVRNVEMNATPDQKKSASEFWKKWYLSIRPDYVFVEP